MKIQYLKFYIIYLFKEEYEHYVCISKFQSSSPLDLNLEEGDEIVVTIKDESSFWYGHLLNDASVSGMFKSTHVTLYGSQGFIIIYFKLLRSRSI